MTPYIPAAIVAAVLAIWGLIVAAVLFIPVPDANKDMLNILIGAVGGTVTTIVGYHFGSSSGSAGKDRVIDKLTDGGGA
jgi:hypothetical protein